MDVNNKDTKILITGAAGFIGYHLSKKLLDLGFEVYGIDNLNAYYDVRLKLDRLKKLGLDVQSEYFMRQLEIKSDTYSKFKFLQLDLVDERRIDVLFEKEKFNIVVNLAAQAGVRYSIDNPKVYVQSNIVGFINILEASRKNEIKHLIYASSSSVYGNRLDVPFSENDNVDHPISLYAATKKSNELMAHTYSHLYELPTTGLRFFTVYGPWGRPDMAPFLFTKSILEGKSIKVFNHGDLLRDFTYIDDVINGIFAVILKKVNLNYRIFNIGNNKPIKLMDFIKIIETHCCKEARLEMLPMQDGDVYQTFANIDSLSKEVGYSATMNVDKGLKSFIEWYRMYYNI
jgi:UDP-glucuronate 4-epimerase